jgi:hypothetical protein
LERHRDFEKIRTEFISYYKSEAKGSDEYYKWLHALGLNEGHSYGMSQESFQWAKDDIRFFAEDAENKYYKVLVAFPLKSMNGNVYKERNLIAAAMSLKGCHPSINHKDEFWLSPENKLNKWGEATVTGAKYEDGAVEAMLKVPKTTLCPVCGYGEPLYKMIDEHKIVNVSLEGQTVGPDHEGFQFNEKGFTLLTSNILPGIPLARIFPMESYIPFLQSSTNKRTIKIVGMNQKMTEKQCPDGYHTENGQCVKDPVFNKQTDPDGTKEAAWIAQTKGFSSKGGTPYIPRQSADDDVKVGSVAKQNGEFPLGGARIEATEECKAFGKKTEEVNPLSGVDTSKVYIPSSLNLQNNHGVKPQMAGTKSVGGLVNMPDNSGEATIQGESIPQLKVALLQAEHKITALNEEKVFFNAKLEEAYGTINMQRGTIQTLTTQVERAEKAVTAANNEKIAFATENKTFSRNLEDITESRDHYRKQYEAVVKAKEELEAKYRTQLGTNLALEQKLTQTNEEYLAVSQKAEKAEDQLKHVHRITNVKTKF